MSSNLLSSIDLTIGMRIYIVMPDKMIVAPVHVKERVTRETSQGIETSYVLDFGQAGNNNVSSTQLANLNLTNYVVVSSVDEAYDVLKMHIDVQVERMRSEKTAVARTAIEQGFKNGITRFGADIAHEQSFDRFNVRMNAET